MRRSTFWIAPALALAPISVHAQIGPGGRAQALGAYTALANDIYGVYYNPAAAAGFTSVRGSIGDFQTQVTGPYTIYDLIGHFPTDTSSDISFARRFSTAASQVAASTDFGAGFKNFAISVLPFASGTVVPYKNAARTQVGIDFVSVNGQLVPMAGSNSVLTGTYGYQVIGTVAHDVGKQVSVGLNLKLINYHPTVVTVNFDGTANGASTSTTTLNSTTTFGADLGALYKVLPGLTVGAALRNFIQPVGGYPTVLTAGAAYRFPHTKALVAVDLANIGHSATVNLGGELKLTNTLALRAGINDGSPNVGVGIGIFNLSYGLNQSHFGVSLSF